MKENAKQIGNILKELIPCTFLPFCIPLIFEIPDKWNLISNIGKWVLVIVVSLIDFILILKIYIKRYKQKAKSFVDNTTAYAFSNAFTISEQKRNYIVERSYDMDYQLNRDSIPYDVHKYIADICKEFENIISEITSIPKQYMSVSFVYRYIYQGADEDSTNWKWIIGKEHTTQMKLNDFINNPETAIYNLVNSKETYIFSNDKKALADKPKPQYYMSTRDYNHNKVGSIFLLKIMFSNNAQSFVESVLTISTYGRRFVENETKEYDSHILRNVIFEEVFPFYQKLLETELGVLYLRHISQ